MIRIAICGYGNIGKGVESAVLQAEDMELAGIFTRRDPSGIHPASGTPVYSTDELMAKKEDIDVLILCTGSATELPEMTPFYARDFHVVDSFDTHKKIPSHFEKVDQAAKEGGKVAVISGGWDPGLFSIARVYASAVLPRGNHYTFWGRGVSQGHSDAIRHIEGVKDARQYTVPVEAAVQRVRNGETPAFTDREKHLRECYVVAEEGADLDRIESEIKSMPNYFADYDTTVTFITMEELKRNHSGLPHGGTVIRNGITGLDGSNRECMEFSLTLDSNPEFTGSVLTALARAAFRLSQKGESGCRTMIDLPPALLSPASPEELRAALV